MLMKSGTVTTTPVSIFAGLVPPLAVSPLRPGSVSATSREFDIDRLAVVSQQVADVVLLEVLHRF